MDYKATARELVSQMTLEEKASLCSGKSSWYLKGIERLGLPEIMVTDGPHGLRKQRPGEGMSLNDAVPSTCFPTACASACSFDRGLLFEIGAAIGDECRQEDVAVLLGPGVNMKRSPLCGRNFEYFSEDPMLAGELGAAFVKGVQSRGVGVSLKHFAANNQETRRLVGDSVIDERTLREIYLPAFEKVVKQARPWTVMCSYNRLNGTFASENKKLLTDILRGEWGYNGLVMSDWGAVDDRVEGVKAGLDLEMPGGDTWNDEEIVRAVGEGRLDESCVDECARRVTELILKSSARTEGKYDMEVHHALARRASIASTVLVKNDGLLPSSIFKTAAVIGAFAQRPRYQGAGSSHINPNVLDNAVREFTKAGVRFDYAKGYSPEASEPDESLIRQACNVARGKDIVYIFAGLPESFESEGFDRETIDMPRAQTELIRRVARVNPNVAVILSCGSVVSMDWENSARAILISYLGGQAEAGAAVDILLGRVSPCAKLAESWPYKLADVPSYHYFPGSGKSTEYRESLYIGYRYYDSAAVKVRYPFGFGLSYTNFEITGLNFSDSKAADDGEITVSCKVTNTGGMAGAEIVQLYIAPKTTGVYRPVQDLKGFEKVRLAPGESKYVWFKVGGRDFAYYNTERRSWCVESGKYEIRIGNSSRNIVLRGELEMMSASSQPVKDLRSACPCYYNVEPGIKVSDAEFAAVLGRAPVECPARPFTINSTVSDILSCDAGEKLMSKYMKDGELTVDGDAAMMFAKSFTDMPLRSLGMIDPDVFSRANLPKLVAELNESK